MKNSKPYKPEVNDNLRLVDLVWKMILKWRERYGSGSSASEIETLADFCNYGDIYSDSNKHRQFLGQLRKYETLMTGFAQQSWACNLLEYCNEV